MHCMHVHVVAMSFGAHHVSNHRNARRFTRKSTPTIPIELFTKQQSTQLSLLSVQCTPRLNTGTSLIAHSIVTVTAYRTATVHRGHHYLLIFSNAYRNCAVQFGKLFHRHRKRNHREHTQSTRLQHINNHEQKVALPSIPFRIPKIKPHICRSTCTMRCLRILNARLSRETTKVLNNGSFSSFLSLCTPYHEQSFRFVWLISLVFALPISSSFSSLCHVIAVRRCEQRICNANTQMCVICSTWNGILVRAPHHQSINIKRDDK